MKCSSDPLQNDPFFRYFFDIPRMPRKLPQELKGSGRGMTIDARGRILTNNHVVAERGTDMKL